MDALALLGNRINAVNSTMHRLAGDVAGLDLSEPIAFGTSPLGLTLWHLPRTQDWLVNTSIRGVPEVADEFGVAALPSVEEFGYGTGLSAADARAAAERVDLDDLIAYSDAVALTISRWLATLAEPDLDGVPEFAKHQYTRPAYCTPEALAEVEHLDGLTIGELMLRPAVSHVFAHVGEIELLVQLVRH